MVQQEFRDQDLGLNQVKVQGQGQRPLLHNSLPIRDEIMANILQLPLD